ncbi:MAG: hypothetical protein D6160_06355 [Ketobacter sp.]|nr:MAG: hypothetical protein D6160_06355 [Ketobacter sp.]
MVNYFRYNSLMGATIPDFYGLVTDMESVIGSGKLLSLQLFKDAITFSFSLHLSAAGRIQYSDQHR